MTRSELIISVAEKTGVDQKLCETIIRTFTDTIRESVANGEKITLSGFGTFERKVRKATVARNPKTHEPMAIPEQFVATFRAGTSLKDAVKTGHPQS